MSNKPLGYKIEEKYSIELRKINEIISKFEQGRIYGVSPKATRQDGSMETNITKLKEEMDKLLQKIQNGEDGDIEIMGKVIGKAFKNK